MIVLVLPFLAIALPVAVHLVFGVFFLVIESEKKS
jgi:hypothetical protein